MGRPPCCYKVGIKKGPWTPEEDIILVSYIQENGPGNWRSVPTNTGLLRCSKSCRLRWTNYLRPGIKRGNFTSHEEGMIIHLQALLGNKWAAIASYLPQRTDNDIKNYWNTHLKKKLKKFQSALDPHNTIHMPCDHPQLVFNKTTTSPRASLLDHHLLFTNNTGSSNSSSSTTTLYASSTENISRLLQGWMRSSSVKTDSNSRINTTGIHLQDHHELVENGNNLVSHQNEFESILSFENMNNDNIKVSSLSTCEKNDVKGRTKEEKHDDEKKVDENHDVAMEKNDTNNNKQREVAQPLSFLEKWLLDESSISSGGAVSHNVEEMLQLSPMF